MAQGSFAAQASAWAAETKARMMAVRNESAQRVVDVMQTPTSAGGRMRVETGFLRASLTALKGDAALPPLRTNPGGVFTYDAAQVSLVIAGSDLKDTLTFVYTANYARPREYGARGQAPDRFVTLAAQQWPRIVDEVVAEARARTGG